MRLTERFPRSTFSRLTLAVLLALSGNATAAVDYSGPVSGDNQPASGSQDWLDAGSIHMGYLSSFQGDSLLRITDGSVVSASNLIASSLDYAQTLVISGTGSQLNIDNAGDTSTAMLLRKGSAVTIENGAQLKVNSGAALSGVYAREGASINVTGVGTRFILEGLNASQNLEIADATVSLSEGAAISLDQVMLTDGDSLFNIGGELGGAAKAPGTLEAEKVTFLWVQSNGTSLPMLNFNHTASDYEFSTKITSNSQSSGLVNVASGTTTLTAQNDYRGETRITGGTLKAGVENAFSANSTYDIASGGVLDLNGFSNTLGDTVNAGTIKLAGTTAGAVLTVNGNYTGNNGTLIFGTELEGDSSVTDRLIVTGDVSGTTNVRVTNLGGSGAETLNGFELITVQGSADSSAFTQQGRIVAGAYDYRLVRGDHNWYLTNRADHENMPLPHDSNLEPWMPIIPDERIVPIDPEHDHDAGLEPWMPILPGDGSEGGDNGDGDNGGGGGEQVLRPEAGAYAANQAAVVSLFDTRMSDRKGTYYLDPVSGKMDYTSLWMRIAGNHSRLNAGGGQLNTRSNSAVTMLGGDIAATDTLRLGLMAGYGSSTSTTHSDITGYSAKSRASGYTTGMYGTWFAEGTDEKGLWTDSTLQYSWFNNSVNGEGEAGESYKSKGISASLSTGYVIPLGTGERSAYFLQPQARVGWSGIKADDHIESNGTRVQSSGENNLSTSLGVKALMKLGGSDNHRFGAFTEVNWINNSKENAVRMDGVSVSQSGSRGIAEARIGVDGGLGNGFGVKGSIGQQKGDQGWSDTSAAVNFSYKF